MKKYRDLREHLKALEDEDLLQRVTRPINKDTELFPLVRWQFRGGIEEHQRKAGCSRTSSIRKGKNIRILLPWACLRHRGEFTASAWVAETTVRSSRNGSER